MTNPDPFSIAIDDHVLDDLRIRLDRTRWIEDFENTDSRYGVNSRLLRRLAEHWATGFDWRAAEAQINLLPQFRVTIDGQPIHFLRIRGKAPRPTPLILSHGWPWTFWDMRKVIEPLTDPVAHGGSEDDAFELIIPSLPGFAFSTPAAPAGANFWRTADLWHKLMTEVLGFSRYGAAGGDWGALVSAQLGHKYAPHLTAVHVAQAIPLTLFSGNRPWRFGGTAEDEALIAFEKRFASHVAVQVIEPQTLAHALQDSPVGLLGWLLQRWCSWGGSEDSQQPAMDEEQMLTNATLYWASGAMPSSLRFYANAAIEPWRPSHSRQPLVEAPTGISLFGGDLPAGPTPAEVAAGLRDNPRGRQFRIVHVGAHERGGHFAHYQKPEAVVQDIRETFRAARGAAGESAQSV